MATTVQQNTGTTRPVSYVSFEDEPMIITGQAPSPEDNRGTSGPTGDDRSGSVGLLVWVVLGYLAYRYLL